MDFIWILKDLMDVIWMLYGFYMDSTGFLPSHRPGDSSDFPYIVLVGFCSPTLKWFHPSHEIHDGSFKNIQATGLFIAETKLFAQCCTFSAGLIMLP